MLFILSFLSFGISTDYKMCQYLPLVGKVIIRPAAQPGLDKEITAAAAAAVAAAAASASAENVPDTEC